jgi:periplasmic protein TonB
MGYQALLFCPDEKLARVVGQVFSELDFAIEPVHEPFAAVKRLMAQRYDAIVVDCENEQNASLLFKSARNSGSNQNSLAIAVVEGQAGVAKAYRIGANLVLTKPINIEQTKGTLRVARGLLRKNSDAASASTSTVPAMPAKSAPVSAPSSFQPASRSEAAMAATPSRPELPEFEAPAPAAIPARHPVMAASVKVEDKPAGVPVSIAHPKIAIEPAVEARQPASPRKEDLIKNDSARNEAANVPAAAVAAHNPSSVFTSVAGSGAAPAPAREAPAPPTVENTTVASQAASPLSASPSHLVPAHNAAPTPGLGSVSTAEAPSFASLSEEDSGGSGGSKKISIAAAILLALAALGYFGYGKLGKSSATPAAQPVSAPQNSGQPAALAPISSPGAAPATGTSDRANFATPTLAPKTATAAPPDKALASGSNSPVISIVVDPVPAAKKPESSPLLVKSNAAGTRTHTQAEESAPPLPSTLDAASANDSALSGLMSSASSNLPKPSLATVRVSQGVSQGLLIKRVQPKYPPTALAVHAEGAVQIEATINKEGTVINPKVLSGPPVLARSALEAVRQWRYKPYYLDGTPVEIQTQITINFKAN